MKYGIHHGSVARSPTGQASLLFHFVFQNHVEGAAVTHGWQHHDAYLGNDRGTQTVVLIDGVDYLITNNGFKPVLRLVQILRDQVSVHGSILLISIPPAVIEEGDLRLLEKEGDHVI